MKTFTEENFIAMPWKNGRGMTTEIFSIRDIHGDILFRLSTATVSQDGPFSHFPHIDRVISLLSGKGFLLKSKSKEVLIRNRSDLHSFKGEEDVFCELVQGECFDFNVMTNRHYAQSTVFYKELGTNEEISNESDFTAIYLPDLKLLHILDRDEIFINKTGRKVTSYQVSVSHLK